MFNLARIGTAISFFSIGLVGCGGGGGGGTPLVISTELNRYATLSYVANRGTTCVPFEGASIEMVVSTSANGIGTAKRTFRIVEGTLPVGMSFNTSTGSIAGVPQNLNGDAKHIKVELTVDGYTGSQQVTLPLVTAGLNFFRSATGGLAINGVYSAVGSFGTAGTIVGGNTIDRVACGGSSFDLIPAKYIVQYGLGTNTTAGATVDPATGLFSWIPPAKGTFSYQRFVDLTIDGKVGRWTDAPVTITVL